MFRIDPAMPVQAYKTYDLRAPIETHFRTATCVEVGCEAHQHGWSTTVDVGTPLGARQANYIRLQSGRHFTAVEAGTLVTFTFPAGQTCFRSHKTAIGRDPVLSVRGGDWRGSTGLLRRHVRADDWVHDFAEHQDKIKTQIERG